MADLTSLRRILKVLGYSLGTLDAPNSFRILDKAKRPQPFGPDGRTVLTRAEIDEFVESVQSIRCCNDVAIKVRRLHLGVAGADNWQKKNGMADDVEARMIAKIDFDT